MLKYRSEQMRKKENYDEKCYKSGNNSTYKYNINLQCGNGCKC